MGVQTCATAHGCTLRVPLFPVSPERPEPFGASVRRESSSSSPAADDACTLVSVARWKDRLGEARRVHFVGRRRELQSLDGFVRDARRALIHVWGPAGVGKSTLLLEWARRACGRGETVLFVPGTAVSRSGRDLFETIAAAPRGVVVIDDFDTLQELHEPLRTSVLPELPTEVHVITAGRAALSDVWLADDGWRSLLRMLPLGALDHGDGADYLRARGVEDDADDIVRSTAGHPLALCQAANRLLGEMAPPPPSSAGSRRAPMARPSGASVPPTRRAAPPLLTRTVFDRAIKTALRNFQNAPVLSESPLLACRFVGAVRERGHGVDGIDSLRHALRVAISSLEPRDASLLEHTYLHGRTKQFTIACDLGMAYSTYRRHLARATVRVTDMCWRKERQVDPGGELIAFPSPPSEPSSDGARAVH